MTKQQKINDLTTQLAEVTAKLVLREKESEQAKAAQERAEERRNKAEKQYGDIRRAMRKVVDEAPHQLSPYTVVWDGAVTLPTDASHGIASLTISPANG